jgi:hypothetical protein
MSRTIALGCAALAVLLAGCNSHSDQAVAKRAEQPPWDAAADPFVVPGWKSGDKASWQQQMTSRAQNQNEYLRVH